MQPKLCIIVPTYNNRNTVVNVIERLLPFAYPVIVVNDGSTDDTESLINALIESQTSSLITFVSYKDNRGKGHALRSGFRKAIEMGFDYAVTIDSDGQHYPEDIVKLVTVLEHEMLKVKERQKDRILVVGNRKLQQDNMPGGNTFANYFSNFWFMLQTWQYLPDTQTGYRIYPLHHLHGLDWLTARYEAELVLLVFAAWHGVRLVSSPIRVYYPPQGERVTHFRPVYDFVRITILNTVLCCLCLYGWPRMLVNKVMRF